MSLRLRIGWVAWATATLIFTDTPKLEATSKDPRMYKENSGAQEIQSVGLMVANGPVGHFLPCSQIKKEKKPLTLKK